MREHDNDADTTPVATKARAEEAEALREFLDALRSVESEFRPIAEHLERIADADYRRVLENLMEKATQIGEVGHKTRRAIWNRLHRRRG